MIWKRLSFMNLYNTGRGGGNRGENQTSPDVTSYSSRAGDSFSGCKYTSWQAGQSCNGTLLATIVKKCCKQTTREDTDI